MTENGEDRNIESYIEKRGKKGSDKGTDICREKVTKYRIDIYLALIT